jgi:hypothetical protein
MLPHIACKRSPPPSSDATNQGDVAVALPQPTASPLPNASASVAWNPRAQSPRERPKPRATPAFPGTAGIVHKRNSGKPAVLAAVRSAEHDGFDRVVFEFRGKRLPGYHVEYIDRPVRQCGSGNPTPIAGDGWLEIRLEPAYAHDELGKPTVHDREQSLDLPVVREAELTCDFEAVVTWVVGVTSPNRYRVMELTEPARLVVDIRH